MNSLRLIDLFFLIPFLIFSFILGSSLILSSDNNLISIILGLVVCFYVIGLMISMIYDELSGG